MSRVHDAIRHARAALFRLRVRWSAAPVGLAIVYHLLDDRTGDPGSELVAAHSFEDFEAHVAHLRRHYRPVRASELPAAVAARRRGQPPPVAITFDDDSRSHIDYALPRLAAAGAPATFFVMGTALDSTVGTWWEDLEMLWRHGDVDELVRLAGLEPAPDGGPDLHTVSRAIEQLPAGRRDVVAADLRARAGVHDAEVTRFGEAEIRALAAAGHEIGWHTLRHYWLTRLQDAELERALTEAREAVGALAGAPLRSIAYPHGRADPRVAAAARRQGFDVGFTTDAGRFRAGDDPLRIGRYWPTYDSPARFAVDVAQLLAGTWGVSVGLEAP